MVAIKQWSGLCPPVYLSYLFLMLMQLWLISSAAMQPAYLLALLSKSQYLFVFKCLKRTKDQ